jgi:hypothetical protein
VSSSRDFGVGQFFRADDFRVDGPSPFIFIILSFTVQVYKQRVIITSIIEKKKIFCIDEKCLNKEQEIKSPFDDQTNFV